MPQKIQVLLLEDNPHDSELILRELRRADFDPTWQRVDTEADYLASLRPDWDLILSDFAMPQFGGLRALELLKESGLEIPFIIVSGSIGEDIAVAAMQRGAADYLLKDRLARLGPAVSQALEQSRLRRESRQSAEALKLFRTLVDRSNDAFEVVDPETGRLLDVNEKGCADLGYSREELLSLKLFDIDTTVTESGWPQLRQKARAEGTLRVEGRHRRKDGTTFPVEVNVKWVRLDRDYLVAVVRDITERKRAEESLRESEERFREIAANINEVFWMTDPAKDQMLYISPAYETIWGRSCASLYASPQTWLEAIHPDDRLRIKEAAINKQLLGEYDETYRIQQPDGQVRWIHDRAFPIRNKEGAVYRVAGTAEDITENRLLEEQLHQAQKMEAIGTLAGGIAHDFNNILAAMNGYTELAKMAAKDNPAVREYLDTVLRAGVRAVGLIKQILAFSRQEAQARVPLQLPDVVADSFKLLRATIPATIEFEMSLAADAPTVLADVTQINQILMNLGTNAWHAMRDKPGRLQVKLENFQVDAYLAETQPRLRPGQYARISISDTGCGMDKETMGRVFEPFFTTKAPGEGTGLGLAVVHGIMQNHDGVVTVYSEPGVGTTFHLYFPAHVGEISVAAIQAAPVPLGHGEHILYLDDEESLAQLGKKSLEMLGYAVEGFTNAAEALKAVRAHPRRFDLVVTDQTMPGMTGVDLARQLLQIRPGLPIILTTGYSAALTSEKIRVLGIRQLLLKPHTIQALGVAVHRALAERKPA